MNLNLEKLPNEVSIVPDTGALIDGRITQLLAGAKPRKVTMLVHQSVVAELEYQANTGREIGFAGLQELKRLSDLANAKQIAMQFVGTRPSASEIKRARFGEIDSKIREAAREHNAVLVTTDKVQAQVASAQGVQVHYLEPITAKLQLSLEHYFTPDTLSVHLKEGVEPKAKRGKPGDFQLVSIKSQVVTRAELDRLIREAVEYSKRMPNSFIEFDEHGVTVLQVQQYRITYTRPPFSDTAELTAVRPIAKLGIYDYRLSDKLRRRLMSQAEGILIAGSPGSGKSTLATALAEFYSSNSKIVKTVESPRDLQVGDEITQYSLRKGNHDTITDVLLLARPDYTIYDEVRKPDDFLTFADLRLAGIGMVGVVHASKPIDAVQRFIGKIELGMIPQVIDTIVFVQRGQVSTVYSLNFTVKTPSGMMEKDLARPVIEVRDFETGSLQFEIYTFGEETVVFPVTEHTQRPREHFARKKRHWKH